MDVFYKRSGFKEKDISLYQHVFSLFLSKNDIDKMEKWALTGECSDKILNKCEKERRKLSAEFMEAGVNFLLVDIMFIQYLMADHIVREMYKTNWVERVLNRSNGIDDFPSAGYVYKKFVMD